MENKVEDITENEEPQKKVVAKKNWFINFIRWVKVKLLKLWRYIKSEIKDWKTFVLFAVVVIVVYSPVWFCYVLYFMFKWKWCFAVASSCLAFWAGPFTPFFPLCIAITLGIKKIMRKILQKKQAGQEKSE